MEKRPAYSYVYKYIHLHIHTYMNMYIWIHIWTCIFAYEYIWARWCLQKKPISHLDTASCMYVYTYKYIYTYEYICMWIYTYVYEPDRLWKGGMYHCTTKIWHWHIFNIMCMHVYICIWARSFVEMRPVSHYNTASTTAGVCSWWHVVRGAWCVWVCLCVCVCVFVSVRVCIRVCA